MAAAPAAKDKNAPRRRLLAPPALAAAVLVGAAAALVAKLLARLGPAPHDPAAPSHFLTQGPQLLGAGATTTPVPVELGGAKVEATVLVAPAAPAAEGKKRPQPARPLVLLLHGFPDDAAGFHAQIGPLTAAGYDVVVPVLPGYEPATAGLPAAAYALPSVADALGQVAAWALQARGAEKVHIVGHDWGAALAYILGARGGPLEGRVASMVTMAVPHNAVHGILQHPWQIYNSWYMLFFQLPLLPEIWFRARSHFGLRKLWRDWSPGHTPDPAAFASLEATFGEPGVLRAAIQYYRTNVPGMLKFMLAHKLSGLFGGKTTATAPSTMPAQVVPAPTLALSGLQDGCIDTVIFDATMGGARERSDEAVRHDHPLFTGGVQVVKVPKAGHFLHQERPEEVNRLMLDWFGRHEAGTGV